MLNTSVYHLINLIHRMPPTTFCVPPSEVHRLRTFCFLYSLILYSNACLLTGNSLYYGFIFYYCLFLFFNEQFNYCAMFSVSIYRTFANIMSYYFVFCCEVYAV